MPDSARTDYERILFESDQIPMEEIRRMLKGLIVQKQRWIGSFHPNSKIRAEAFRASGVEVGEEVFISIGMVILDDYKPIVRIGDRAAFGNYVSLVAASSPNNSVLREYRDVVKRCIKTEPISIGEDVWVGTGAVILPGVTIGEKCIIGAGAVVVKDTPPCSVAAGVPAKVIRKIKG